MFYWLYQTFAEQVSAFNLFKYLTFRSGAAVFTSLILSLALGGRLITFLRLKQHGGQPIREDGPKSHLETKKGTPTMGGVLILFSWTVSCLLWMAWDNAYVWIALLFTLGCGGLGFADDYLKVVKRNPRGVSGKTKLIVQFSLAAAAVTAISLATPHPLATQLSIPLFKDFLPNLGLLFFPFAMVVMTGASNAVNLTDGLDGLATMPAVIAAGCFALIAYLTGNAIYSGYLGILHVPNAGELAVFCSAMIGAGLGFLWYNAPPARVFMGDVGSLALGGALGVVSVITKHEIVLAIVGGLFVMEAISVILQVYYFKLTKGKRLFRMAPLHHHFELRGWPETAVVVRFWIVSAIFALLGLATLKIR